MSNNSGLTFSVHVLVDKECNWLITAPLLVSLMHPHQQLVHSPMPDPSRAFD